jgi:hypothetical protein
LLAAELAFCAAVAFGGAVVRMVGGPCWQIIDGLQQFPLLSHVQVTPVESTIRYEFAAAVVGVEVSAVPVGLETVDTGADPGQFPPTIEATWQVAPY